MFNRFVLFALGALLLLPACEDDVSVPEAQPDYSSPEKVVRSYFDWSRDYLRERQIPRMQEELSFAESLYSEMMPGLRSDIESKFEGRMETLNSSQKKVRTLAEQFDEVTFEVARRDSANGNATEGTEFTVEFDVTLTKPEWDESVGKWTFPTETKTIRTKRVAKGKWKLVNYEGEVPAWLRGPFVSPHRVMQRPEYAELVPAEVASLDRSSPESLAKTVVQNFGLFERARRHVSLEVAKRDRRADLQVSHWMTTGVGDIHPSEEFLDFMAEHQGEAGSVVVQVDSIEMPDPRNAVVTVEATSKFVRAADNPTMSEGPYELAEHVKDYRVDCNKISGEWYVTDIR